MEPYGTYSKLNHKLQIHEATIAYIYIYNHKNSSFFSLGSRPANLNFSFKNLNFISFIQPKSQTKLFHNYVV